MDVKNNYLGLYNEFEKAANEARPKTINEMQTASSPESRKKQLQFMEIGFELINLSCNSYIQGKVDRQRTINLWRDAFAPMTAFATGIYSIADNGKEVDHDALTALALFTSAASSGFDIYEQRYLFGAKNVDNVRRLVLRAQLAHATESIKYDQEDITYWKAVRRLAENQMDCSPGAILDMVGKAIAKGDVDAVPAPAKPASDRKPESDGQTQSGGNGAGPAASPTPEPESSAKALFVPIEIRIGE